MEKNKKQKIWDILVLKGEFSFTNHYILDRKEKL